jgi:undecaprenyl diphosphate synthase
VSDGAPFPGPGIHVGIIMDGNGRWAVARGRPRRAGHEAGASAVRRVVEAAPELGISVLTLFAFSSDNWKRPPEEVSALMRLFRAFLAREARRAAARGVRIVVVGRRDRLPRGLVRAIALAEEITAGARSFLLRIAVDYSARDAILAAAQRLAATAEPPSRELFARLLAGPVPAPDVDLLIRTGGERRLSDFLLWECAYAELVFSERMWPDFSAADLGAAVAELHRRERRFGAVPGSRPSLPLAPALAVEPPQLAGDLLAEREGRPLGLDRLLEQQEGGDRLAADA